MPQRHVKRSGKNIIFSRIADVDLNLIINDFSNTLLRALIVFKSPSMAACQSFFAPGLSNWAPALFTAKTAIATNIANVFILFTARSRQKHTTKVAIDDARIAGADDDEPEKRFSLRTSKI
jgi:hypothetical protein